MEKLNNKELNNNSFWLQLNNKSYPEHLLTIKKLCLQFSLHPPNNVESLQTLKNPEEIQ